MKQFTRKPFSIILSILFIVAVLTVSLFPVGRVQAETWTTNADNPWIQVVQQYSAAPPPSLIVNLQYTNYYIPVNYLFITSGANIRALPDGNSAKVGRAGYYEKVTVLSLVHGKFAVSGQTDLWYEVVQYVNDQTIHGYILATLGEFRTFQFQKMVDVATALKSDVDSHLTAYISNYKNWTASPPFHKGNAYDDFGVERDQAAPAYYSPNTAADFRYMADGTMLSIIASVGTFYQVRTLNFAGDYYVPKRYVSLANSIDQLTKVIVVDRKNQNEGVLEYAGGQWHMISYTFATTGANAKYKEPTDLGYYMAIGKQDKFIYKDDITKKMAGYAPYAIRFGGGAYIHGVPVDVKKSRQVYNRLTYYPPMQEYSLTIGTTPRSHKCVRNYTSHALFLYNWSEIGKTAVIVIE